jgi:hypothetical protein
MQFFKILHSFINHCWAWRLLASGVVSHALPSETAHSHLLAYPAPPPLFLCTVFLFTPTFKHSWGIRDLDLIHTNTLAMARDLLFGDWKGSMWFSELCLGCIYKSLSWSFSFGLLFCGCFLSPPFVHIIFSYSPSFQADCQVFFLFALYCVVLF